MTQEPKKSKQRREIVVEIDEPLQLQLTDALTSAIADALIEQASRMRAAGIQIGIEGAVA